MKSRPIFKAQLCLLMLLFTIMFGSCKSEEETNEPVIKVSEIIIGNWNNSSIKILDENGNEINEIEVKEIAINNIPKIEFKESGNYTITYPEGKTESGQWNISNNESIIYIGELEYNISSFDKDKIVITQTLVHNEKTYYIKFIFDRTSSPETPTDDGNDGDKPGIDETSDNNPYKPYNTKFMVSKITKNIEYTNSISGLKEKHVYLFKYDKKNRIMEYTRQIERYAKNDYYHTVTHKYNFKYDDKNVYIYCNDALYATGIIGNNGYLTELHTESPSIPENEGVNATFRYGDDGFVTYIKTYNKEWFPEYEGTGDYKMLTSSNTDYPDYSYGVDIFNFASVDLNGLTRECYNWEWEIYDNFILGLFDFYGKRTYRIIDTSGDGVTKLTNGNGLNISNPLYGIVPTMLEYQNTGGYDPFVETYEIEYIE